MSGHNNPDRARKIIAATLVALLWPLAGAGPLEARLKLTALPDREAIVVNLENPAATLIEEERVLALQEGVNQVDFAWRGVNINPDSIRLAVRCHPDDIRLLNVSYPPGEAALVWEIYSPRATGAHVRISYLLSAIDRLVTYRAAVAGGEETLDLRAFLVLRNFSGEDFEAARLVMTEGAEHRGSIRHEETREVLLFERPGIPIRKVLTWDAAVQPWDPSREETNVGIPFSYRFHNTGEAALEAGKARVFQDDGRETTIFMGEDRLAFTPPAAEAQLTVGQSRDVVVTQHKRREERVNIRRGSNNRVILYDSDEVIQAEVENFSDRPQELLVRQHIPGQWDEKDFSHPYELRDAQTLEFTLTLAPREKAELNLHYRRRNIRGNNQPLSRHF